MVTSKIILLLRKLCIEEQSRFREYLCSPFFNNKSKLIQFYDELVNYSPGFEEKNIERIKIYKKLYPSSKFNNQVYKNLSSELYSMARDFISISQYKKDEYEQNINLLEKLESYGADSLFVAELKSFRKKLSKSKYSDMHFLHKFKLALLERNFLFHRSRRIKLNAAGTEESDELMKFYFIHAFRQRFDFETIDFNFNVKNVENSALSHIRKQLEQGLVQETIDRMVQTKSKDNETVALFYYILMSFKYPENNFYFNNAKDLVFNNINKFDSSARFEISDAIYSLFSYRMMLNASEANYRNTFDIINFRLQRKIYKETTRSYFDMISFRAIFMTGVRLKEYEWLKKFLRKYIGEVMPEHRENLNNLLTGFIKFFEKRFEVSLEYLNKIKYNIPVYKLDVRKLQLMNYYELNLLEPAFSLIASFKEFLNNNKALTIDEKVKNLKMLRFCSKLFKIKDTFNEYELAKLEKDINENPNVLYSEWFKEKIEQLKKDNKKGL